MAYALMRIQAHSNREIMAPNRDFLSLDHDAPFSNSQVRSLNHAYKFASYTKPSLKNIYSPQVVSRCAPQHRKV